MPPSPVFKWDTRLGGTALVAGQTLSAALFLQGGKPAVWSFDVIPRLQLSTLFDDQPDRSPSKHFSLSCAYWLFNLNFGESSLLVTTDPAHPDGPPQLAASLMYDETLGPWSGPFEVDFAWSRDAGFQITNFPSIHLLNLPLDFAALLQTISNLKGCGGLGRPCLE